MSKQDDSLFKRPEGEENQEDREEIRNPEGYTRLFPKREETENENRPSRLVVSKRQMEEEKMEEFSESRHRPKNGKKSFFDRNLPGDGDDEEDGEVSGEESEEKKPVSRAEKRKQQKEKAKEERKKKRAAVSKDDKRSFIKKIGVVFLIGFLFIAVTVMVVSNFVSAPVLQNPKNIITSIVTPVQNAFSRVADSVTSYLRALKVRGNIEYEYEQLLKKLDDLASEAAMAEEYKRQINDLYDLMDEINRNTDLQPVPANVIGHDTGNYFSTLTINVGSNHGIKDYMAVAFSGGLVGYTYNVKENTSNVRCIIDNDATVFGMIQSSRDQGAVKGTLGLDGEARCRMYYLPENSLPRPGDIVVTSGVGMEFPKGIPIGTVRESSRGMDENMSFIVVEPIVDFQHLEYVVVYRYQPSYAETAQERVTGPKATTEPLVTARPQPTFQVGIDTGFGTGAPDAAVTQTPAPSASPAPGESVSALPSENPLETPHPDGPIYQAPEDEDASPTPSPSPSPSPSPTPNPTFNPDDLTVEED